MQVSCFNDCRSIIHPLLGALFIVVNLHVISSKVTIENSSLLDALVCNGIFWNRKEKHYRMGWIEVTFSGQGSHKER
jgi:hypothetical protein